MPYHHLHTSCRHLALCALFLFTTFAVTAPAVHAAPAAASLRTGVVPTMGLKDVTEGALLFRTEQPDCYTPAPMLKSDIHLDVSGLVARARVRQEFTNPSTEQGDWLEGIYVFPLPETAAVDHLRMRIGERIIEGHIKERSEAKQVYEQAKQEGRRTGLIEQERPNIFTTSVANIGPGERVVIEIEYQETIRYDHGRFQLRVPTAVGPRYIPGTQVIIEQQPSSGSGTHVETDRVPDAARITPPLQSPDEGMINPVSLSLTLKPGFPVTNIESPSHPIITIPNTDGGYQISLRADDVPADRDFQLQWAPRPQADPIAAVLTEEHQDATYAMVMLVPPTGPPADRPAQPRDLTFIIDTSGSMIGPSIDQAKAAVSAALTRLTTHDRVNIIQFNHTVRALFETPQPVTPAVMRQAVRYTEQLSADGGTEMLPALRQALRSPEDGARLQQLILLTDGQVGNEDEMIELLQHHVGTRRLFTIGIGSTPNSYLMRKAAEFGRGTFTYIGNVNEVKDKLDGLFHKLEHPVLSHIAIDATGWSGLEQYPATIADLYAGEPIVLAIRATSWPSQATLRGQAGGRPWSLPLSFAQAAPQGGLSVYWARQKISALMDERHRGAAEDRVRTAVLDTALAHHLVSRYTSLVAVDVTPARPTGRADEQNPATSPALAHSRQALADLPKTGTSGPLHLMLGIVALLSAAWLRRARRVTA